MDKLDKKKRHISGSRSKSKKSKPNDASIQLKSHKMSQALHSQDHSTKIKTDNSLNKSKGSKKLNKYTKKLKVGKGDRNNVDESKQISRSASAERKHSLVKMNKTEANFEGEDMERKIYALKRSLSRIEKPCSVNTSLIMNFYQEIQESIEMVSEPLYSLLSILHELYSSPMHQIIKMIEPYEHLLCKKDQLSRQVQEQVRNNEQIYGQLTEEELQIIKLKETIEEQRELISQKKRAEDKLHKEQPSREGRHASKAGIPEEVSISIKPEGLFKNEGLIRNVRKDKNAVSVDSYEFSIEEKAKAQAPEKKSMYQFNQQPPESQPERDSPHLDSIGYKETKTNTLPLKAGNLKLDLGAINSNQAIGFHDEFYAKLDEFSQSWRNQAIRQKRF